MNCKYKRTYILWPIKIIVEMSKFSRSFRAIFSSSTSFIDTRLFYRCRCGWISFYIVERIHIHCDALTCIDRRIVRVRRTCVFWIHSRYYSCTAIHKSDRCITLRKLQYSRISVSHRAVVQESSIATSHSCTRNMKFYKKNPKKV